MKLIFLFASIASALHYSVVLKNENALVIPYYALVGKKILLFLPFSSFFVFFFIENFQKIRFLVFESS